MNKKRGAQPCVDIIGAFDLDTHPFEYQQVDWVNKAS